MLHLKPVAFYINMSNPVRASQPYFLEIIHTFYRVIIMSKVKTRDGKIELMRFCACLMIMSDHMHTLGLKDLPRPFRGTWVYVEFFLILSGFFTAKHFASGTAGENKVENAIKYTINKYKRFLPYSIAAVFVYYIIIYRGLILHPNIDQMLTKFGEMPIEMLMLSAAGTNGTRLYTMWFISATFVMTPFICLICQVRNKYITVLLSFYPGLIYYLYRAHSIGAHEYPNQLIRAFCGMALGVAIYHFTQYLNSLSLSDKWKKLLTLLIVLCYAMLLYIGWKGFRPITVYLMCFVIIVTLTFSTQTYLPSCSYKPLLYVGQLSMPLFIWHPVVSTTLYLFLGDGYVALRIILYYGLSLAIAAISMQVFNRVFFKK